MIPDSEIGVPPRAFASDNEAGALPEAIAAIAAANAGHAPGYGADAWTALADAAFRAAFGDRVRAFPVFNGTGANVAALAALTRPHEAVVCSDVAHVLVDECGAPERVAGIKLLPVPTPDGKLRPADLERWQSRRGDAHCAQPRVVSITQATELGTVYSAAETRALAAAAHRLGMHVHVDGARLANAAAALDEPPHALTAAAGVDVVSFGGTKAGLLYGDAVLFCRPALADQFEFTRKQLGQLASKMRFVSAQLAALLTDDLWLHAARQANAMAARLAAAVAPIEGVELVHPVQANAVFARLDRPAIDRLVARWRARASACGSPPAGVPFHVWDESTGVCRWMCAWDTEPEDVDSFAAAVAAACAG